MTYDVIDAARRTTRRRASVAGLVVVAVLGVASAIVLFVANPRGRAAAPSSTGPSQPSASRAVPGGSQPLASTGPQVLPADLAWTEVAGVALPMSSTTGPRDARGGRARGFAHTEAGALLASVHLLVRTTAQVGPTVFDPTIAEQVVGPDAASMRDRVTQMYAQMRDAAQVLYGQPVGRLSAVLRGFRINAYAPTDAAMTVLTEATDDTGMQRFAATEVHMRWTGEDWALVAPAGGTWDAVVLIVTAEQAATFTPFGQGR